MTMNNDLLIRIDERVAIMKEEVTEINRKIESLDCKTQQQKVTALEKRMLKTEDHDSRINAIEKVFWPSVLTTISGLIGVVFTLFKMNK
jgi:tRNA A37 threonylcarbamoyladenosine dehydratase